MANEKRLIDAEAYPCQNCEVSYCYKNCKKFNEWLNNTVDAVEVVRCKDCKHQSKVWISDKRMKEKGYFIYGCKYEDFGMLGADDDFCSYGERRTDGK